MLLMKIISLYKCMQLKSLVLMRCNFNEYALKYSDYVPKDLAILDARKMLYILAIQAPRI